MYKISKKEIPGNSPYFINYGGRDSFIILKENNKFTIVRNICPHMGGWFTKESFCSKDKQLSCHMHGYLFSTDTLKLEHNPNIEKWIKPLVEEGSRFLKMREYKLISVDYDEDEEFILIRESVR